MTFSKLSNNPYEGAFNHLTKAALFAYKHRKSIKDYSDRLGDMVKKGYGNFKKQIGYRRNSTRTFFRGKKKVWSLNQKAQHVQSAGEYVERLPSYFHRRKSKMNKVISHACKCYPSLQLMGTRPMELACQTGKQSSMVILLDTRSQLLAKYAKALSMKWNCDKIEEKNSQRDSVDNNIHTYADSADSNPNRFYATGQMDSRHYIDHGERRFFELTNNSNISVQLKVIYFYYKEDTNLELLAQFMSDNYTSLVPEAGAINTGIHNPVNNQENAMLTSNVLARGDMYNTTSDTGYVAGAIGVADGAVIRGVINTMTDYNNLSVMPQNGSQVGVMPWKFKAIRNKIKFIKHYTKQVSPAGRLRFGFGTNGTRMVDTSEIEAENHLQGVTLGMMLILNGQLVTSQLTVGETTTKSVTYGSANVDIIEKVFSKVRPCKFIPNQRALFGSGADSACKVFDSLPTGASYVFNANTFSDYTDFKGDNQWGIDDTQQYHQAIDGDAITQTQRI